MNEIKFRFWSEFEKRMIPWEELQDIRIGNLFGIVDRKCLMQYIGIKDYEGIEIYEGDLLRVPPLSRYEETTYNCFEVFYHDNEGIVGNNIGFCINRIHCHQGNSAGGRGYKLTPEEINRYSLTIIGNIFEDKELLS